MFEFEAIFTITGPSVQYEIRALINLPYVPVQGMDLTLFPFGPTLAVEHVRMNVTSPSGSLKLSHHDCGDLSEMQFAQEEKKLENAGWRLEAISKIVEVS
jgi:hypothetical protein